jgi:hypothetical protein
MAPDFPDEQDIALAADPIGSGALPRLLDEFARIQARYSAVHVDPRQCKADSSGESGCRAEGD